MSKKGITVTAIANGEYGNKFRVPGDTFEIADEEAFSDRWMVKGDDVETERFVATGGTDGVVGTTVETKSAGKLSAKERKEREKSGISDNDDRTDDFAASSGNDAPPPEPDPDADTGETTTVTTTTKKK